MVQIYLWFAVDTIRKCVHVLNNFEYLLLIRFFTTII